VFPSKTARAVIFRYHHRIDAHMWVDALNSSFIASLLLLESNNAC
jgi:hypothetical protein